MIKEYVLTGKVRLEFRNLRSRKRRRGRRSGRSARRPRATSGTTTARSSSLIQADAGQLKNEKIDVGRFTRSSLGQVASEIGMDAAAFDTCLDDPAMRQAVVDQVKGAQQLGLNATPSFLVNGTPLAGAPRDVAGWRQLLDGALAKAQ